MDDNVFVTLPLDFGVPQGSVLCLLLYLLYTALLGDILCKYGLSFLLYADDTKVYVHLPTFTCPIVMSLLLSSTVWNAACQTLVTG